MYNTLSSAACLSIAYGYLRYGRNSGPVINANIGNQNFTFRFSAFSIQSMGLIGFTQNFPKLQHPIIAQYNAEPTPETDSLITGSSGSTSGEERNKIHFSAQCPIDWTPKDIPSDGIYGLKRITRHPMLFSLGLCGLGIAMKTACNESYFIWISNYFRINWRVSSGL